MKKIILCGLAAVMMLATVSVSAQGNAWNRKKYLNIGYVMQNIDGGDSQLKSDMGLSLSWGKQYYLHSKPLAKMIKFGLDWSWVDLNYASFSSEALNYDDEPVSIGLKQIEYAMQVGPSITINPYHDIKISAYFRVSPSFSLQLSKGDGTDIGYNYVTFMNAGASFAWRILSVGVEYRWGNTKYKSIDFGNLAITQSDKLKVGTTRIYFGLRF